MKLNTFERLNLLSILPKEGDYTTLKIMRKLREVLSFTEEEHKRLGITVKDGVARWKSEADEEKEIVIGEKAHDIIVETLTRLSNDKVLKSEHIGLYEKFVIGTQEG